MEIQVQSFGNHTELIEASADYDGTCYRALIFKSDNLPHEMGGLGSLDGDQGYVIVCCLNGRTYPLPFNGRYLDAGYVAEKFHLGTKDAINFAEIVGAAIGRATRLQDHNIVHFVETEKVTE